MESHPLYLNLDRVGRADISGGALYAECRKSEYVVRLYDGRENLGVMQPEGDLFVLRKKGFRLKSRFFLIRSLPGETPCFPLFFPLSHGESRPDLSFVKDELLRSCLAKADGLRGAFFGDDCFLYFPAGKGESAMSPFFFLLSPLHTPLGTFYYFLLSRGEIKTFFSPPTW